MAALDLETEYSPRVTVCRTTRRSLPAGRARLRDYRADTLKSGECAEPWACPMATRRGNSSICSWPAAGEDRAASVMFIHGGYWRAMDPSFHSHMARGLNERGFAVAVVGYDLCPIVTIADIIEQIRHACAFLWLRFGRRFLVSGHCDAITHRAARRPWSRPTGKSSGRKSRAILCRPATLSPACSMSRRW